MEFNLPLSAQPQGWINDPIAVEAIARTLPYPYFFAAAGPEIRGSSQGQQVLSYLAEKHVFGRYISTPAQTRGTCVGRNLGLAISTWLCSRIAQGRREMLEALIDPTTLYAGARVEIGKRRIRGDGAIGAEAVQYAVEYGLLLCRRYEVNGFSVDLTVISDALAAEYGGRAEGVPNPLEPIAREHPVLTFSKIESYRDTCDVLANNGCCIFCSNTIWGGKRDAKGHSRPKERGGHCVSVPAFDDKDEPGVLLDYRSWGDNWASGPKRLDQPDSTIWAYAEDFDRVIKGSGDSWGITDAKTWKKDPHKFLFI